MRTTATLMAARFFWKVKSELLAAMNWITTKQPSVLTAKMLTAARWLSAELMKTAARRKSAILKTTLLTTIWHNPAKVERRRAVRCMLQTAAKPFLKTAHLKIIKPQLKAELLEAAQFPILMPKMIWSPCPD